MKKLVILELDKTTIRETFTAYAPGIYQKRLTVDQATQDTSFWVTAFGFSFGAETDIISVGSMRVNNVIIGAVESISELRTQDGAFYFDSVNQTIYLSLYDYENCWQSNIYLIGETTGIISEAQNQEINGELFPVNSFFGGTYYDPRLLDISAVDSVDDQSNGIFVFDSLTSSIRNADGVFDTIREDITGNDQRLLVAHLSETPEEEAATGIPYKIRADIEDFSVVRRAIVEDVSYSNPDEPVITGIDPRADLSQKIGQNFFTKTAFPDIADNLVGKRKPIIIGAVNGATCELIDEKPTTSTDTDFLICDTSIGEIASVDDIYFDGKISGADVDRYLLPAEYEVDTSTGILTVYNYDSGKAWFYGTGVDLNETIEILLFLYNTYANYSYIQSNFNILEVEQIRALNYQTHVYINKNGQELFKAIEKLVMDINVDFFQQGSVYTARLANEERAAAEEIPSYQLDDDPCPWVNDRTETIKTISVTYNNDYRLDEADTYYDNSRETEALTNNRKAVDKEFETNLTTESQVAEIYGTFYERFSSPSRTVIISNKRPFASGLTDFIILTVERRLDGDSKVIFNRANYKITKLDRINNTAEAVYFSDVPEPVESQGFYYGMYPYFYHWYGTTGINQVETETETSGVGE